MSLSLLRNNVPIFSMLVIFLIDLFLILTTHYNWNHSMSKYLPLKSNIQYLKSELSEGHLWLEEAIGGDKYIDIQKDVIDKFTHEDFKLYVKESKDILLNRFDNSFYNDLLKIEEHAQELEEISIQRWTNKTEYRIGSDLDQIFDEVFNETIELIDNLNSKIDHRLQNEFYDRKEYFTIIITLFLLVNILAFALLYKIKKENLKYEDELYEEKKRAEITLYSIGDAVITTDENGFITFLNPIAQKLTDYGLEEAKGLEFEKVFNIFNDKTKKKIESPIKKVLEEGIIVGLSSDTLLKNKNGKIYNIEDSAAPIKDEDGKILGTVVVFHDVTEQKKLQKDLVNQEKVLMQQSKLASMGEMLENIAHQWRQPLSAITTAASGMKLEKEYNILKDEAFFSNIDAIITSSNSLSRTIDHFRNFFKPHDEKVLFNINSIFSNALDIMNSKFESSNIRVIKNFEDHELTGFSSELLQVLIALLNNSYEELLEKNDLKRKLVFISSVIVGDNIFITIKDNAGGFDEAEMYRIFEPYFTTKHKSFGKGVGLYMVQEIITKHMDGKISVQNSDFKYMGEEYRGLEFTIKLKKD